LSSSAAALLSLVFLRGSGKIGKAPKIEGKEEVQQKPEIAGPPVPEAKSLPLQSRFSSTATNSTISEVNPSTETNHE
jgi:hypothetical protein